MKPFRFGFQATSTDVEEVLRGAQAAEEAGFDTFQVGDHVGAEPAALTALAAAAMRTERIRLGTLVLNNDLHHPVTLAQQLATLDHLCAGRLEVGLGAGHSFTEYRAMGLAFNPPSVRKERLAEAVGIIRALLDGSPVTFSGQYYDVDAAVTLAPAQAHVPLLVGVNGRAALAHAAQHADIVAPTMLGRTHDDGHHHDVRWEAARLDRTIDWIRQRAQDRWPSLELHALVQAIVVTEDREAAAAEISTRTGMSTSDLLATPYLCLGTQDEMAQHLLACRERWGINYYSVRDVGAFAPVLELLRRADARQPAVPTG